MTTMKYLDKKQKKIKNSTRTFYYPSGIKIGKATQVYSSIQNNNWKQFETKTNSC